MGRRLTLIFCIDFSVWAILDHFWFGKNRFLEVELTREGIFLGTLTCVDHRSVDWSLTTEFWSLTIDFLSPLTELLGTILTEIWPAKKAKLFDFWLSILEHCWPLTCGLVRASFVVVDCCWLWKKLPIWLVDQIWLWSSSFVYWLVDFLDSQSCWPLAH